MGANASAAQGAIFARQREVFIMQGLEGVGKTTILQRLCCGEAVTAVPTVGFSVEAVDYKGRCVAGVSSWDEGGCEKLRPLWRHFYREGSALVYVVDSSSRGRIDLAAEELERVLEEDQDLVNDWPVLILANKQDASDAMTVQELCKTMQLSSRLSRRRWHAQACCALSGEGLHEGLDWLAAALRRRSRLPRLPSRSEAIASLACSTPRRSSSSGGSSRRSSWSVEGKALSSLAALAPRRSRSNASLGSSSPADRGLEGKALSMLEDLAGVDTAVGSMADSESTMDTEVFGEESKELTAL